MVDLLDELAPVQQGNKSREKTNARRLSNEAVAAKRLRRKLERRWKSTGVEADRVEYRAACRIASDSINSSRNQHRHQHIIELKEDSRRTWSAVTNLLHGEAGQANGEPAESAKFCSTMAAFFTNKVHNIQAAIE